jgi:translation elongation factor EF-G
VLQVDDQLAELFLSEEPIDAEQLAAAIRRATLANKFAPVFMGSAYKNKGALIYVTQLTRACVRMCAAGYFPASAQPCL